MYSPPRIHFKCLAQLTLSFDCFTQSLLAYEEMNFKKVSSLLTQFINSHVSAFYCHLVKDR